MAGRKDTSVKMTGGAADGMSRESGPKRKRGMCVIPDEPKYFPPILPNIPEGATKEKVEAQEKRRLRTKYERSFPG